jgi:hypothetical protein
MTYPIDPLNALISPYVGYIGGPRGKTYTITNAELDTNVATLTIGAHSHVVGDRVVASSLPAPFVSLNGSYDITAVGATTVSYDLTGADIASAAVGAGSAIVGPRLSINEIDNLYVSEDGIAYRHYKNDARSEFWDELLVSSDTIVDATAPLGGTGAQYPV